MFDVAVIGLGAAGSAALAALARAGVSAIGVDRYAPPHAVGSSHGETRLLRVAYAEGALYVPMARRAIELWRALEARSGRELFRQTGIIYAGPHDSAFLSASLASAREHGVHVGERTPERRAQLEAALRLPADWLCCVETEGGYLLAEDAIAAMLGEAREHGAEIRVEQSCRAVEPARDAVRIVTDGGIVSAKRCIVAAGAWTAQIVPALAPHLHVERKTLHWFADPKGLYAPGTFMPFLCEDEAGRQVYGFPDCGTGVKVAEHTAPSEAYRDAAAVPREVTTDDANRIVPSARRFCPGLGAIVRSASCLYPMSKDGHFIIDVLPGSEGRVFVAAGLSGHGFKFAPVIGEAVAHLALGRPQHIDLAPFSLARF